ncbi:hypothetical protein BGZ82_003050 [Podila clonocystis]|nr:hypothetical protein BGZ82_003050 [Podila clonocystis]
MPLTQEELDEFGKPNVIISGGGIGGLTLAILLHKANIPFLVLERAKEIKPLGSAIALGAPVPRERILLGKRVLSSIQNEDSVLVRCSDNSSYQGDILVGADGAYSAWITFTTAQNTVCWMVIHFLDKDSSKRNDSFRNSEWGPEAAEALAREVRPFKIPGGRDGKQLTLGEYVDRTPSHSMSKVMLEEIVFDTWYGGRTVLLGDACHKMNPTGGSGAITAIHDAVTLANWLSIMRYAGEKEVKNVFKEYRSERYPVAKEAFASSQMFTRNVGKNTLSVLVRAMMKRLPRWLWKRIVIKVLAARHQASFLPLVEDNAPVKPIYQQSLHKTLAIHKEKAEKSSIVATGTSVSAPVTV